MPRCSLSPSERWNTLFFTDDHRKLHEKSHWFLLWPTTATDGPFRALSALLPLAWCAQYLGSNPSHKDKILHSWVNVHFCMKWELEPVWMMLCESNNQEDGEKKHYDEMLHWHCQDGNHKLKLFSLASFWLFSNTGWSLTFSSVPVTKPFYSIDWVILFSKLPPTASAKCCMVILLHLSLEAELAGVQHSQVAGWVQNLTFA